MGNFININNIMSKLIKKVIVYSEPIQSPVSEIFIPFKNTHSSRQSNTLIITSSLLIFVTCSAPDFFPFFSENIKNLSPNLTKTKLITQFVNQN